MTKGLLLVISGPSGVGKGTIINSLLEDENIAYSVSATTRSPRPGEVDGVNYHYITKDEFKELIDNGDVLEYAEYTGNYYGTPRKFVEQKLNDGKSVVLEIETCGAMQIKKKMPEAVLIFICPPSIEELESRLRGRGTETEDVILRRLETARHELTLIPEYDYAVINENGEWEKAARTVKDIVNAEQHSTSRGEYPKL